MINIEIINKWRENILNNLNSQDFENVLEKILKQNPLFIPEFVKLLSLIFVRLLNPINMKNG